MNDTNFPIWRAARLGEYDTVLKYLEAGGDPNIMCVAVYGPASLLHAVIQYDMAVMFGHEPEPNPVAKLLVDWGADLQSKDACGMSVEYVIKHSGHSNHYLFLLNQFKEHDACYASSSE